MIDFIKSKKKTILCILGVVILISYYVYTSNLELETTENEILVSTDETKEENTRGDEEMIMVHIAGAVNKPGVVELNEGSRIEDAIELAGGLSEDANINDVNLAYVLEDGIKINIPSINDEYAREEIISDDGGSAIVEENLSNTEDSLLNINTATATDLETLPGIGPTIANKIVEYREENGDFDKIEEIKNVSGIGESKYSSIEEYITVK